MNFHSDLEKAAAIAESLIGPIARARNQASALRNEASNLEGHADTVANKIRQLFKEI